ncbi:MAG: hypothetical protein JW888_02060, partial [Pirellulales bacterium]|nr:hypothetical protein [Pirellulales bacterium]
MKRILRVIIPIVLCVAGFGLVIHGVRGHMLPVVHNREIEETITIPQPPMDPMDPWMPPPPPIKQTIKRLERETIKLPE